MKDLSNENVIHVRKDGIQYLQFRKLLQYGSIIRHAYSLGTDLNFRTARPDKESLTQEELNTAITSYQKICTTIGTNAKNVVKTNQEHTDNVRVINQKINREKMDINLDRYNDTDGLITNKSNLLLSTTNADCILMLFFDPKTRTIANIHSGWKGTLKRIAGKTVDKMIKEFNSNPKDIICCISPSIRKCHFEVDIEVKEMFEKEFKDLGEIKLSQIIEKQDNKEKWNIDTVLINKIILEQKGLVPQNIVDSGICSVCNSDLIHSYRVEKQGYGLSTALIELK